MSTYWPHPLHPLHRDWYKYMDYNSATPTDA